MLGQPACFPGYLFRNTLPQYGIETTFVDVDDPAALKDAIREETKCIFIETIGNPGLDVPDVVAISAPRVLEIDAETQRLQPDGKINLRLVGEVKVVGMTAKEVARLLGVWMVCELESHGPGV